MSTLTNICIILSIACSSKIREDSRLDILSTQIIGCLFSLIYALMCVGLLVDVCVRHFLNHLLINSICCAKQYCFVHLMSGPCLVYGLSLVDFVPLSLFSTYFMDKINKTFRIDVIMLVSII